MIRRIMKRMRQKNYVPKDLSLGLVVDEDLEAPKETFGP